MAQCEFKSVNDTCGNCVRKGIKCGEKTRRGGAQDTVRISVLESLAIDHPEWSLADVINHLNGSDGLQFDYALANSPESDCSEFSSPQPCPESFESFNLMDFAFGGGNGEPLNIEFATPGK